VSPREVGPGRRVAIAALLHRLNGGLNNAALAFELALSTGDSAVDDCGQTLERGRAGVEQASRAATLLALMLDPDAAAPSSSSRDPYAQDVAEILRAHARRIGCDAASDPDRLPALRRGDLCRHLDDAGAKAMAKVGTVAVLLPAAFYALQEKKKPPVELLRSALRLNGLGSPVNPVVIR